MYICIYIRTYLQNSSFFRSAFPCSWRISAFLQLCLLPNETLHFSTNLYPILVPFSAPDFTFSTVLGLSSCLVARKCMTDTKKKQNKIWWLYQANESTRYHI